MFLIDGFLINYCIVCYRQVDIMNHWKTLQQLLQQQKEYVGDAVNTFAVLRDIELISLDLRELQVNITYVFFLLQTDIITEHYEF